MALSKCPKCDSTQFEVQENSPVGSRFKIIFVQCSRCGCVVGVTDYRNIGYEVQEVKQELQAIKQEVHYICSCVR